MVIDLVTNLISWAAYLLGSSFGWVGQLLSLDWVKGVLVGACTTVLGHQLAVRRDTQKNLRDLLEREKRIMNAINEDLTANRLSVAIDLQWIQHELSILGQSRSWTQPLYMLKEEFWDLAVIHLPNELLVGDKLAKLREISFLTQYVNEAVRSRNDYRLHNQAAVNYFDFLESIDRLLLENLKLWAEKVLDYLPEDVPKTAEKNKEGNATEIPINKTS